MMPKGIMYPLRTSKRRFSALRHVRKVNCSPTEESDQVQNTSVTQQRSARPLRVLHAVQKLEHLTTTRPAQQPDHDQRRPRQHGNTVRHPDRRRRATVTRPTRRQLGNERLRAGRSAPADGRRGASHHRPQPLAPSRLDRELPTDGRSVLTLGLGGGQGAYAAQSVQPLPWTPPCRSPDLAGSAP